MTGTLPLEIASSLRLILVGDTGIGKSKSRSLFLNSVPGQVQKTQDDDQDQDLEPNTPDVAALSLQDTNGQKQNGTNGTVNEQAETDDFITRDAASTLEIPAWLSVSAKHNAKSETSDAEMVPADNIVIHDFVGYGQSLDAKETIDRVDIFLAEQYIATRDLFGAFITPLSMATRPGPPAEKSQPQPFLEKLLVNSPMAHSLPDACLYFVLYDLKPVDIAFMKRIMGHVNLIPILAKADTLSANQLWKAKARILKQLEDNQIEFFQFGFTIEELKTMAVEKQAGGPPFALSTSDLETQKFMDRWKTDLGIPLEQKPAVQPEEAQPQQQQQQQEEEEEEQQQEQAQEPVQEQAQEQEQEQEKEQEQEQEQKQEQEPLRLQQPTPIQQQQAPEFQQPSPVHQYQQQSYQQQQQQYLPPALQQQTYQPTSSYSHYVPKSSPSSPTQPDEEVGQVIKLSRAQSVIRSASPTTKIYTQGAMVPSVPSLPAQSESD
ncbi:Septin 4 [Entomortierella chlamydospora]|uniref:Septin 4 n=1 Tax=Entomortierella chlamydospora TaxID=101097 RepID=A0A9P6MXI5_9FUNG|nr:Septin 4 [Entomortierella chlamydospora]